jgi:hypothetical protein
MASFAPVAERCGSEYTAMNIEKANEYLLSANDAVKKSRIAIMVILIWVSVEILPLALCMVCCFFCAYLLAKNNDDTPTDTDVVVQDREAMLQQIEQPQVPTTPLYGQG